MKFFTTMILLFSVFSVYATEIKGKAIYKLPSGDIKKVELLLDVPEKGVGEVTLTGEGFVWKTDKFWSVTELGQTKFFIVFNIVNEKKENEALALIGTYLRGTKQVYYYGDFYSIKGEVKEKSLESVKGIQYTGGFIFYMTY